MELLKPPIEIRELTPAEVESLRPDFVAAGADLPTECTTAVGIFHQGKIVGYQFLQVKLHIQPTKIDPQYAHLFGSLCAATERFVLERAGSQWAYIFCPADEHSIKLCQSRGMTPEPWVVMSKHIGAEEPSRMEPIPAPVFIPTAEQLEVFYPTEGVQ